MNISLFWLERGGRWGSSPLTSPANHQKLTDIIQKWTFHFFGVADGVRVHWVEHNPKMNISLFWLERGGRWGSSINQPGWPSEVECNPKMSISLFWLERGGRWGSSPLTSLANHQKLNVIQKWAFQFFGWRGVVDGIQVHRPAWPIIRSWMQSKNEHFTFLAREGWQMGFESIDQPGLSSEGWSNPKMSISIFWLEKGGGWGFESIDQPGQSSEVECNPKMSISLFWLERGGRWGSSPLTSSANHQKLNAIQKWTFHFFG